MSLDVMPYSPALFILLRRDGVFVVSGGLDARSASALRRTLETNPLGNPKEKRLVDLRGLTYLDSDGIAVLCEYADRLHFVVEPGSVIGGVVHAFGLDSPVGRGRAPRSATASSRGVLSQ